MTILLKFEKCHGICLSGYSSAVYWSTGPKLGREVGDGHGKNLAETKFWNFNRLPWKSVNFVKPKILVRFCWIFYGEIYSTIVICLQKMNKIYQAVSEIGPPLQLLGNQARVRLKLLWWRHAWRHSHARDVLARVTSRDVILCPVRTVSLYWVWQILNF